MLLFLFLLATGHVVASPVSANQEIADSSKQSRPSHIDSVYILLSDEENESNNSENTNSTIFQDETKENTAQKFSSYEEIMNTNNDYLQLLKLQTYVFNLLRKLKLFDFSDLKKYYDTEKEISGKDSTETKINSRVDLKNATNQDKNEFSEKSIKSYSQLLKEKMKEEYDETQNSENDTEEFDTDKLDEETKSIEKDSSNINETVENKNDTENLESNDLFKHDHNKTLLLNSDSKRKSCDSSEEIIQSEENISLTSSDSEESVTEDTFGNEINSHGEFSNNSTSKIHDNPTDFETVSQSKSVTEIPVTQTNISLKISYYMTFLDDSEKLTEISASPTEKIRFDDEKYSFQNTSLLPAYDEKFTSELTTVIPFKNEEHLDETDLSPNSASRATISNNHIEYSTNDNFLVINPINEISAESVYKNPTEMESKEKISENKSDQWPPTKSLVYSDDNITSTINPAETYNTGWILVDTGNSKNSKEIFDDGDSLSKQDKNAMATTVLPLIFLDYLHITNTKEIILPPNNNSLTELKKLDAVKENDENPSNEENLRSNLTKNYEESEEGNVKLLNSIETIEMKQKTIKPSEEKETRAIEYKSDSLDKENQKKIGNLINDIVVGINKDYVNPEFDLKKLDQRILSESAAQSNANQNHMSSDFVENQKIENYNTDSNNNGMNEMQYFIYPDFEHIKNNYDDGEKEGNDYYLRFIETENNDDFSKTSNKLNKNSQPNTNSATLVNAEKISENSEESKEYFDTILEYLYKHSNSSFIQALKTFNH